MINIITEKGPLETVKLKAIAALYGKYDHRFKDIEYCRIKFNDNPAGYSFHSFAYDEEDIIGHCAIIPLKINNKGCLLISGKSEAMVLKDKYRSVLYRNNGKESPMIFTIVSNLYEFAFNQGVEVIHAISLNPAVAMINQLSGFKKITVNEKLHTYILDYESLVNLTENKITKTGIKLFFIVHKFLNIIINYFMFFKEFRYQFETRLKLNDNFFCDDLDDLNKFKWNISKDNKTINWFFKSGKLDFINISSSSEDYIILWRSTKPDNSLWIIDWNINKNISYIKIFNYIINIAKKEKKSCIIFPESSITQDKNVNKKIKFVIKIFFFIPIIQKIDIYVKSEDKFYLKRDNLNFNSYFYSL